MSNTYCNYRNNKYKAKIQNGKVLLVSKIKQDGFSDYIDILGKRHNDLFMKELAFNEAEVVYKECIEICFEGVYFQLLSFTITKSDIEYNRFTLFTDSEELAKEYKFEKKEQFVFIKEISKEQIQRIKILQKPIKEFETNGIKEIVIEKDEIDEWFLSLDK